MTSMSLQPNSDNNIEEVEELILRSRSSLDAKKPSSSLSTAATATTTSKMMSSSVVDNNNNNKVVNVENNDGSYDEYVTNLADVDDDDDDDNRRNNNNNNNNNNNSNVGESGNGNNDGETGNGGGDGGERPNLTQSPSNRSFRLDWPSSDNNNSNNNHNSNSNNNNNNEDGGYGHQARDWFREFLDCINQFRFNCGMFVNNGHVQFVIIILITINAIMMGIGTFSFVKENPKVNNIFEIIDLVFLYIFTIELGLQFIYHGWRLILDGWLDFDLIIIVTSWSFSSVQIIRAFRIFRALRLVTRIKIMKNLILALFGVMPRMAAIGLMLALIFYIFSVMFTQLFKDLYENGETDYNYFSGMGWTTFTLFQMMTLDNWASIARQVIKVYNWAWAPFIAFVIISGFIVVNLIIAVICDAISALHKDDKAKLGGTFDNDTDDSDSQQMEIREQLDCLEEQMEELTRIQARTFHTLQYLTRQMQMNKLKQELRSSTTTGIGGGSGSGSGKGGGGTTTTTTTSSTAAAAVTTVAEVSKSNKQQQQQQQQLSSKSATANVNSSSNNNGTDDTASSPTTTPSAGGRGGVGSTTILNVEEKK